MMDVETVFSGIKTLAFDTAPLIYFAEERHPAYLEIMDEIIGRVDAGEIKGFASVITLLEVMVYPLQKGDTALEKEYRSLLKESRNFTLISIDPEIALHAANLRSRYKLRTPDALQIAAASFVGCDAFLTNDKRLRNIDGLKIIILDDLEITSASGD